jgi:hypothetical protein
MAVFFTETFAASDNANDYLGAKWTSITATTIPAWAEAASGRGPSFTTSSQLYKSGNFGSKGEFFMSFIYKYPTMGANSTFLDFADSPDALQLRVRQNSDNTLSLIRGSSTVIATSSLSLARGPTYRMTLHVVVSNTGSYRLAVDGIDFLNGSGDTQATGTSDVARILFRASSSVHDYSVSDVVMWDTTGSILNGWKTGIKPVILRPTGDGNSSDLTPLSGANWENVDETDRDGDASYNASGTDEDLDLYEYETLSGTYNIYAVVTNLGVRKDDATIRQVRVVTRKNSTNYNGTAQNLTEQYDQYAEIEEVDPDTSAAWIVSGVNAAEFGPQVLVP